MTFNRLLHRLQALEATSDEALEALEALSPSLAVVVPLAPSARQEVPTEAPCSEETRVEEQPPAKRVRRPMALVPRSVKVARPR